MLEHPAGESAPDELIDVHCHHVPSTLLKLLQGGLSGVSYEPGTRVIGFPSGPARPIPKVLLSLPGTSTVGSAAVAARIVSPWLDIVGEDLDENDAIRWCRLQNDLMADATANDPKLFALAALPLTSGETAAEELVRVVSSSGFVGGVIPTQIHGRDLDLAVLDPLFQAAVVLNVPLFVHPLQVMAADRMKRFFLWNVCGNPFETTVAAMSLFLGGTFDRHPTLKILLAHAGGALPWLAGRLSRASETGAGGIARRVAVDELLGCFYFDSVLHDARALRLIVERQPSRLVLGSDDPFPMSVEDPLGLLDDATGAAHASMRRVIAVTNARDLFRLR